MKIRMNSTGPLCRPAGHNNYLRPADSVKAGGYFFFMREKHLLGPFKGFFMEIETFLISKLSQV